MKPTTTIMIATAALLAAATTGSAQSLKAEIPFKFEANGARMQPGSYQIRMNHNTGGAPTMQIFNVDERKSIFALPRSVNRPEHTAVNGSDAVLTFECTDGRCALARIWDGSTSLYTFPTPKPGAATHVATIVVRHDRGD